MTTVLQTAMDAMLKAGMLGQWRSMTCIQGSCTFLRTTLKGNVTLELCIMSCAQGGEGDSANQALTDHELARFKLCAIHSAISDSWVWANGTSSTET